MAGIARQYDVHPRPANATICYEREVLLLTLYRPGGDSMRNTRPIVRSRCFLAILASSILVTCVSGCESVHMSGDPGHGGVLKRATDVMATAAVGVASEAKGSTMSNVWQDAGGMWHWTRTDHGGGIFKCEGHQLGVPTRCDRI